MQSLHETSNNKLVSLFISTTIKYELLCYSTHTQVVLVSSSRDAHHHCVYPTPPYVIPGIGRKFTNLKMVSDPCLISINGLVIGVTATDILMHLGRCEVAR
jgi:DNA polymerase alpha subunit B